MSESNRIQDPEIVGLIGEITGSETSTIRPDLLVEALSSEGVLKPHSYTQVTATQHLIRAHNEELAYVLLVECIESLSSSEASFVEVSPWKKRNQLVLSERERGVISPGETGTSFSESGCSAISLALRSLALRESDATRHWMALALVHEGREQEAEGLMREMASRRLSNEVLPHNRVGLGARAFSRGSFGEAMVWYRQAAVVDEASCLAAVCWLTNALVVGELREVRDSLSALRDFSRTDPCYSSTMQSNKARFEKTRLRPSARRTFDRSVQALPDSIRGSFDGF